MKVLIADNDERTLSYLADIMSREGFDVIRAQNGQQALSHYQKERPDFVCLDIMMPEMDGYDVCRTIRETDPDTPVIFISSKTNPVDRITGLNLGADDYVVKPFDVGEVIARIRAVARRCLSRRGGRKEQDSFTMADLTIYPEQLKAQRGNDWMDLSLRDIKILRLLHDQKNRIIARDTLLDYCWGAHIMPESRTVDWHISQLRKRIEKDPRECRIIRTVHGIGYKYEE